MLARPLVEAQRREAWGESREDAVSIVARPRPHGRSAFTLPALQREGLAVPREPAYAAKRSQDGEAQAASE